MSPKKAGLETQDPGLDDEKLTHVNEPMDKPSMILQPDEVEERDAEEHPLVKKLEEMDPLAMQGDVSLISELKDAIALAEKDNNLSLKDLLMKSLDVVQGVSGEEMDADDAKAIQEFKDFQAFKKNKGA
jgi:hypothetical protein